MKGVHVKNYGSPKSPNPKDVLNFYNKILEKHFHSLNKLAAINVTQKTDYQWPKWCFLPTWATISVLEASQTISAKNISNGYLVDENNADISERSLEMFSALATTLATWKMTQGIYRFDETVYNDVKSTPLEKNIPYEIFFHLPEWCPYIEMRNAVWQGKTIHGFYAYLDCDSDYLNFPDANLSPKPYLSITFNIDGELYPNSLSLGNWSLEQAIEGGLYNIPLSRSEIMTIMTEAMNLLLYVGTQASEITTTTKKVKKPSIQKIKGNYEFSPAERSTRWEVGIRLGAALKIAYRKESEHRESLGEGSIRPHIRRAHWHGYWTGSKNEQQKFLLKWLPAIAVKVEEVEELPAVIRAVA